MVFVNWFLGKVLKIMLGLRVLIKLVVKLFRIFEIMSLLKVVVLEF